MKQADRVLAALRLQGDRGITQVDFLAPDVIDSGPPITRVPARILELAEAGHDIEKAGTRDKCRVYKLAPVDMRLFGEAA